MKQILVIVSVLSFSSAGFSARFYEYLNPFERKVLSGEFKDVAMVFSKLGKKRKYLNSLRYAVELYPISDYAKTLSDKLKENGINVKIEPSYQKNLHLRLGYRYFIKRRYRLSLNSYLMALEIDNRCADAYLMAAKCYYKLGNKKKAGEFVSKSVKNGVDKSKIPSYLKKLLVE